MFLKRKNVNFYYISYGFRLHQYYSCSSIEKIFNAGTIIIDKRATAPTYQIINILLCRQGRWKYLTTKFSVVCDLEKIQIEIYPKFNFKLKILIKSFLCLKMYLK